MRSIICINKESVFCRVGLYSSTSIIQPQHHLTSPVFDSHSQVHKSLTYAKFQSIPKKKNSHISAITYVHKMYNVIDNTHHFAIWKIVKGTQNLRKTSDTRLPITIPILKWILVALQHTLVEENCILLLRGIFLLAFHGFLGLVSWFLVATKFLILFYKEMTLPLYQVKEFKSFLNISRPCKITNLLQFCYQVQIPPYVLYKPYNVHQYLSTHIWPPFSFQSRTPVMHSFVVQQPKLALA